LGTSSSFKTSGPPNWLTRIALMQTSNNFE
jgi:hypothetical protein